MKSSDPTTILGKIAVGVVCPRSSGAQTLTLAKLHDFTRLDGSYPEKGLLRARDQARRKFFEFDVRSGGTPAHA